MAGESTNKSSTDPDLPPELAEFADLLAALPAELQEQLDGPFDRVLHSVRRRRRILRLVQDALSQLRLDIKYLMFDLEMTRKERDELQEQLGREFE